MLSFYIQSNRNQKPKQNKCATVQILKKRTHFHMLTSMYHTSSASLLLPQGSLSACDMFTTDTIPFLEFDQHIWIVLCQRLSGWVHFPLPPFHHTEKPVMYAQRIKLKAHNYPSQRSGDSDPITAEDEHASQTMQEATVSALIPADRLEWVWFTNRRTSSGSVFGTPMLLMDLFHARICSTHRALLCVLSVSVCVFSACHDRVSTLSPPFQIPSKQESYHRTGLWLCVNPQDFKVLRRNGRFTTVCNINATSGLHL